MNAPLLFTHDDLDGIGAAVVATATYGESLEFRQCSTQEVNGAVSRYLDAPDGRSLLITDLSVNAAVATRVDAYASSTSVILLDHHITAQWLNRYPWATVDLEACGTLLAYRRLQPGDSFEAFARVVDDYDRWLQRDPRAPELNRLYEAVGPRRFLGRFVKNPDPGFTADERLLLDVEAERLDRYIERVETTLDRFAFGGHQGAICFADRSVTEVAAALLGKHDLDLIAIVNFHDHKVSLRSTGAVDVSVLAKRLGGGGHPAAAGFALPEREADRLRQWLAGEIRVASEDLNG